MAQDPSYHTVAPGDRLSRIAFIHGYPSTGVVWDAPENADLRSIRKNPEILMPGDRVFLPAKSTEAHASPEKRETSLAHAEIPSEIRLRLMFGRERVTPRGKVWVRVDTDPYSAKQPYVGEVRVDDGLARFHIDPRVTEVILISEEPAFSLRLLVGHLMPLDAEGGVGLEQRLHNLGAHCSTDRPAATNEKATAAHERVMRDASRRFEAAFGQAPTRAALERLGQP